jgi:tetratricopeptide (TPR) repeat protein
MNEKNKLEKKIEELTEKIALESDNEMTYSERGKCYYQTDSYNEAIKDFSKAIELNPNSSDAYWRRECCYFNMGRYAEAVQDWIKAFEVDLECGDVPVRDDFYMEREMYVEAAQIYTTLIKYDCATSETYLNRGICYYNIGRYSEAIEDIDEAVKLNSRDLRLSIDDVGLAYKLQGDCYKASQIPTEFILGKPVQIEETRHYEFKEIKGDNPTNSIKSQADQYAVAFLNSEGGHMYWGIRDTDRSVVGVKCNYSNRDEIRRVVTEKLNQIQPSIAPTSYRIEFHQVYDDNKVIVPDLYVIEMVVPRPTSNHQLYFTGKGEAYVKTDGGKRHLSGPQVQEEILKRQRQDVPKKENTD